MTQIQLPMNFTAFTLLNSSRKTDAQNLQITMEKSAVFTILLKLFEKPYSAINKTIAVRGVYQDLTNQAGMFSGLAFWPNAIC